MVYASKHKEKQYHLVLKTEVCIVIQLIITYLTIITYNSVKDFGVMLSDGFSSIAHVLIYLVYKTRFKGYKTVQY